MKGLSTLFGDNCPLLFTLYYCPTHWAFPKYLHTAIHLSSLHPVSLGAQTPHVKEAKELSF